VNFYKHLIRVQFMGCIIDCNIRSKRAQFFILAAVIISAVIISFGLTSNMARVNKEPENFYDLAFEVKKETGAVMDYAIFKCGGDGPFECDNDDAMVDFVRLMATDVLDKDPEANFLFIYGRQNNLKLKNYGAHSAETSKGTSKKDSYTGMAQRFNHLASVTVSGSTFSTSNGIPWGEFKDDEEIILDLGESSSLGIQIAKQEYLFEVSEHNQVIFILEKEVEDESFISVS
jgi:hypothetical protein